MSLGRLNLLSCLSEYSLCSAFLVRELLLSSHLRSWALVVLRRQKDSTVLRVELHRVMGVGGDGLFLKSTITSTVFRAFCSRLFSLHQDTRWSRPIE